MVQKDSAPGAFPVTTTIPSPPSVTVVPVNPSVWDRISSWASENKVMVYTLATVTVIATGAGIYYISNSSSAPASKNRRQTTSKSSKRKTPRSASDIDLQKITEEYIDSLSSDEVSIPSFRSSPFPISFSCHALTC